MSRAILEKIVAAIDDFVGGRCEIPDLQANLDGSVSALDRSYVGLAQELRILEADLEEIRFARLLGDQRPAAVLRLDPVRKSVVEALEDLGE